MQARNFCTVIFPSHLSLSQAAAVDCQNVFFLTVTMPSRPGPKGSPYLNVAALSLGTDSNNLSIKDTLLKSGYKENKIDRAKAKAVSKAEVPHN
jgi:hypothetical protein